jgi:redox-sensing transcriptional repressor
LTPKTASNTLFVNAFTRHAARRQAGGAGRAMKKVSTSTVGRLSMYLRLLQELAAEGSATVSSGELAQRAGVTAAQVRKDLSLFGTFGKRGLGYDVGELLTALRTILGLERRWRVALVGAGRIGAALLGYQDFRQQGFYIEAVFDADPAKVGERWHGHVVRADREMEAVLERKRIDIAIIAVPAEAAQGVVDRIVGAGVRAMLNFAPTKLDVPPDVVVKNVNMTVELEGLSYALANANANARAGADARRAS